MHFKERTALRYGEKRWIVLFRKILKSYFFPQNFTVYTLTGTNATDIFVCLDLKLLDIL